MSYFTSAQRLAQPQQQPFSLWISGQTFAHNLHQLAEHNITAILSLGSDHFNFPPHLTHLYLELEDTQDEDITRVFDTTYQFIEKQRKTSNVLIHCIAGVSRSATIATYYLMRKYRWTTDKSLKNISNSRPCARPNLGFWRQLKREQTKLGLGLMNSRF